MGEVVPLRPIPRPAPIPTPFAYAGWRLAWVFRVWPVVGFVPVWVVDWP